MLLIFFGRLGQRSTPDVNYELYYLTHTRPNLIQVPRAVNKKPRVLLAYQPADHAHAFGRVSEGDIGAPCEVSRGFFHPVVHGKRAA